MQNLGGLMKNKIARNFTAFAFMGLILTGCSNSASQQGLNAVGSIAGSVVGGAVGGVGGAAIKSLGANAGNLAGAFDTSIQSENQRALQYTNAAVQHFGRTNNIELERYIQQMVNKLAANIPAKNRSRQYNYQVRLLKSPVVNAATPGGGYILVYEGLIGVADNEAMLAAVLAHEIGHVEEGHINKGRLASTLTKVGANVAASAAGGKLYGAEKVLIGVGAKGALNTFSRTQETNADVYGVDLMIRAGYDPREAANFHIKLLERKGGNSAGLATIFNSHPLSETRIRNINNLITTKYNNVDVTKLTRNTSTYSRLSKGVR